MNTLAPALVAVVLGLGLGACSPQPAQVLEPSGNTETALERALRAESISYRTIDHGDYWRTSALPFRGDGVVFKTREALDAYMTAAPGMELEKYLGRRVDFDREDAILVISPGHAQEARLEITAVEEGDAQRTVYAVTWTCEFPDPIPSGFNRDRAPICNESPGRPYHFIAVPKSDKQYVVAPLVDANGGMRPFPQPWPYAVGEDPDGWKENPKGSGADAAPVDEPSPGK